VAESRKERVDANQLPVIETLTWEMKEDLAVLEKMLKRKRCEVTGEDRERHEMVRYFMKLKLKDWETSQKKYAHKVAQERKRGLGRERFAVLGKRMARQENY
jgi:hypothetical protein